MGTIGDIRNNFQIALDKAVHEAKQPTKKAVEEFWLEGFKKFMNSKDFAGVSSRISGTGEVLRANFGANDGTAETKIIEFLKEVGGIDPSSYNIEFKQQGIVSSDFAGYTIIFNTKVSDALGKDYKKGDFITITNRFKVNKKGEQGVVGRKDLTPDNLGITKNIYQSAESLFAVVSPAISNSSLPENYKKCFITVTESIMNNSSNKNKFKDFDAYLAAGVHDISYSVDNNIFEGIDPISIQHFQNDYGEILGGFMFFNILQSYGVGLSYPKSSNEKLVDFYFSGYSISSKGGKGGTPSGDTIIQKIYQAKQDSLIQAETTIESDFLTNVVEQWVNPPKLARSGTYDNIMNLCNVNIKDHSNSGYWLLCSESKLDPSMLTQDAVVSFLDTLYDSNVDEFSNFISKLWDLSKMQWNKAKLNEMIKSYPTMGKNKIGIVFYALMVEIATLLTNTYSNELSKFGRMVTDVKQLYLDVSVNKGTLTFKTIPFKSANFQFEQKGSMPNPFNANMGIKVIK